MTTTTEDFGHIPPSIFGLEIDAPPNDWVPIKVVVSMVCLDADGAIDTWHTMTEGCHNFEAMGLIAEHQAILNDAAPYVYFNLEDEDDD